LLWGPAWSALGDLVGWWPFDETSGNVARDGSRQGNDGTIVGSAVWVSGRIAGAAGRSTASQHRSPPTPATHLAAPAAE